MTSRGHLSHLWRGIWNAQRGSWVSCSSFCSALPFPSDMSWERHSQKSLLSLSLPQTPNLKLLKAYERNWGKMGLQIVLLSWLWILFPATTESLRKKLIKGRLHGLLFQVKKKKILWYVFTMGKRSNLCKVLKLIYNR